MESIVDKKLSFKDQSDILGIMFGFECLRTDPTDDKHIIIYDEEGDEFYGFDANLKYDLSTIRGVIYYAKDIAASDAIYNHNNRIKSLLNIK